MTGEGAKQNTWIHAAVLAVMYVLTRCVDLLSLPMFNDEAIYIRWATLVREDPTRLFISSIDGKSPLFTWFNALTLGLFDDVLLSGRAVSVLAGAFAVAGIYLVGKTLYSPSAGFSASAMYLLFPFSTIHDRMALMDTMATAFVVWLFYFIFRFAREENVFRNGIAMGLAMGLGFLTKTPVLMFFIFPVLGLLFFSDYKNPRSWKGLAVAYAAALIVMAPYLSYEPPTHTAGTSKVLHNAHIWDSLAALLKLEDSPLFANIKGLLGDLWAYVTWPLALIFAVSALRVFKTRDRKEVFLFLWFLIPSAAIAVLGRVVYSRYYLFAVPPVALLSAMTLAKLSGAIFAKWEYAAAVRRFRPAISFGALGLVLLPAACFDYKLIRSPESAGWVEQDRWQYADSEYSGYGIKEAVDFFVGVAREKPVVVFVTETWGMPGDALHLYLRDRPNIQVYEAWWFTTMPVVPANIEKFKVFKSKYDRGYTATLNMSDLKNKEVYFVDRDHVSPPAVLMERNPNLKRIRSFKKLEDGHSFSVYRLDPSIQLYVPIAPPQARP
ncbi:MAG: glycosyltransferase family 39 protein [Nitrospinae bacterium]|nr:glycosyltransferase family 39 protein [Nitrospinota bacterium]